MYNNSGNGDVTDGSILAFPSSAVRIEHLSAQKHHALLDTVLNNMSQGVLMFDVDARMVFCNRRYIETFKLGHDIVSRGCSFRTLLDHQKTAAGMLYENLDDHVTDLLNDLGQGRASK